MNTFAKKTLALVLLALGILPLQADIDWNVPYLLSARSGVQYNIVYTNTTQRGDSWTKLEFDESKWKQGKGPVGDINGPDGSAPIGLTCNANGTTYNLWFRRHFTLTTDISQREVWLACGHDDEGAMYIDGVQVASWGNEWDFARYQQLTDEQKALLTPGEHVIAVWAKNNTGGFYYDCGLYGTAGNEPLDEVLGEVVVDCSTWEEHPLTKKFGVYQTPWVRGTELTRDLPKLGKLEARAVRYEMSWGNDNAYGEPSISGTKSKWKYNFTEYDKMYDLMRRNTQALITSHGYCPTIISDNGDCRNVPNDWEVWAKINADWADHWKKKGYGNHYVEIWNEPDCGTMFFLGTEQDYYNVYKYAAPAIRETNPDLKIGGPVSAVNGWHKNFVNFVRANKLPLDFISCHAYGTPGWQFSTIHDVLSAANNKEAEIVMSEFAPYSTGEPIHNDGPVERSEHAMRFFNSVNEFLSTIDLTYVTWAQYIDVVDGAGHTLIGGDKMGLIDGSTGKRKAIYNAFRLYGWMPLKRMALNSNCSLQGLASKDENCVSAVIWNNSSRTMPFKLQLKDIPFQNGYMETYRIDETKNSWYETHNDVLTPEYSGEFNSENGQTELTGTLNKEGVWFVRIMADKEKEPFKAVNLGHVVRTHQYYYNGRDSSSPYAYFDAKTWTTSLSLNKNANGWAVMGVTAENLPEAIHVSTHISDNLRPLNRNSSLSVQVNYETSQGYTHRVDYQYYSRSAYSQYAPWGLKKANKKVIVDDFSNFCIPLSAEAPEGFTGRVIITFELAYMGAGAKAEISLAPASAEEVDAIHSIERCELVDNEAKKEKTHNVVYDMQGRMLGTLPHWKDTGKKGIYIVNGRKMIK